MPSSHPIHEVNIIQEFEGLVLNEVSVGSEDSYLLVEKCYAQLKKICPAYSNQNLDLLLKLDRKEERNTPLFKETRKKLIQEALHLLN